MEGIRAGLKGVMEIVVKREHLASFTGNVGAEVLSTHFVVLLMEKAGREAIETLLPAEKMTVGIWIRVKHFAATPLGMKVRAEANLKEVNRRRLVFETAVFDEIEKVAEGENVQIIVSKDRFLERIQKKKQRLNTN